MVFHRSLSDSKSPQMSRTLLSIMVILNNVVVWMVSTHPLISKSSSPFNNPLVTIPKAPITIGIILTLKIYINWNILIKTRMRIKIYIILAINLQFLLIWKFIKTIKNMINHYYNFLSNKLFLKQIFFTFKILHIIPIWQTFCCHQ